MKRQVISLNHKTKQKVLNVIMAGSVLLLGVTGYEAYSRNRTQNGYEALAMERQTMEASSATKIKAQFGSQTNVENQSDPGIPADPGSSPAPSGDPSDPRISESPQRQGNQNSVWLDINPDFLGWLNVPGTSIDYPYVRSQDNADYLKLDFYRKPSKAGTLFMDYRNLGSFRDRHLLIYGHNMKNGTMFHDLVRFHDPDFYKANREITVTDLYRTRRYQIFSVYEVSADEYELPVAFDGPSGLSDYMESLALRSMHPQDEDPLMGQQLLTLVTCSYGTNNGRTIVHAMEITD